MNNPLILIDGSSYLFRAFHALPPLINSKGQATGAIYGVANMIKRIIKDYSPSHMAIVFDAPGKTFRNEWYPEYKAHRPPVPHDLSQQFQPLMQLLSAMGLPLLCISGVEADDVIGTLAEQATRQQIPILISTSDKDLAQLVNEHVTLIDTMSQTILNPTSVVNKFGVKPSQIIDYLALVGDTSDNVPGVSKCGPKTAVKWLAQYETLDNLLAHAHEIGGKIGDTLRESFDIVALSKRLVTIKTDCELKLDLTELKRKDIDTPQLLALVDELEFKTWSNELRKTQAPITQPNPATNSCEIITNIDSLNQWLNKAQHITELCLCTFANISDLMSAEIVGIALSVAKNQAIYIPFSHQDDIAQLKCTDVLQKLKPMLENPHIAKLGYNLKDDFTLLKQHGVNLSGIKYDIMLESYVYNSLNKHLLDNLASTYIETPYIAYSHIVGTGAKQVSFDTIKINIAADYAQTKISSIFGIHQQLYPLMPVSIKNVFNDIEMPLVTVLAEIERTGVLIDAKILAEHGIRLKKIIKSLEEEAYTLAGVEFNLNSPKQLQEILYDVLKLPIIAKTPTGQPSTAESVLEELALSYRLPSIIIEYRGLTKLVSTYIDALPKCINPQTGRVHTSYNQAVTATGRLSSSAPNLQNIPIRSEEGRLIRHAFIAPEDCVIISADYSQIELRIMAHLSQDPQLLHAFSQGWDIHRATASEIFSVPLEHVSDEQRRRAKAINFGLIYGMSAFGLAKQLGIERADAELYLKSYFERYPGVLQYMESTREFAHKHGYVETIFGRRLYLPEINATNHIRRKAAERMAINAPMQGTAADLIKKAMLDLAQWQNNTSNMARMIMQVHDELVFEVNQAYIEEALRNIKQLMENTIQLSVPLSVSIGVGKNWDAAHS